MKIVIDAGPTYPVPAVRGGAVSRVWDGLARALARRGHDVEVRARAFPGQPERETIEGVRFRRSGGFDQHSRRVVDLTRTFFHARRAARELPDSDILVTNDFWLPIFAGRSTGKRRIVVNAQRYPKRQYPLYRKAHVIAASSEAVARAIARQTPALGARTLVLPNPIDTSVFHSDPDSHSSRRTGRFVFVGRIHPEKGLDLLINAFRLLRANRAGCTLEVVGPHRADAGGGGENYLRKLKELAAGIPVNFIGPVYAPHQLAALLREADVFCYPSLAEKGEAFGVAALEAMACGAIPVVSKLECFEDFIAPGKTGFTFDHRHPQAAAELAGALAAALAETQSGDAMRNRAAAAARAFSFDAVAAKYDEVFASVLPSARHREITPVILTLNEEANVGRVVDRLTWASRVVVIDSGSTDATLEILRRYPSVEVIHREFDNHTAQWNFGVSQVTTEWALSLDADYILSDGFAAEMADAVASASVNAYAAKFKYSIDGRALRSSLYPERTLLFRRKMATYVEDGHTQRLHVRGPVGRLKSVVYHDDRKAPTRWLEAQHRYAALEAKSLLSRTPGALSFRDRIRRETSFAPLLVLVYCLFVRGLILQGRAGVRYSRQRMYAESLLTLQIRAARRHTSTTVAHD